MDSIVSRAILTAQNCEVAYSKFITANDVGKTGAHQAGFHISKDAWPLFFDKPGIKGNNKDIYVTINWQDEVETSSRFIYYGAKTRNEYRLTRFGREFLFFNEESVGDLLVICRISKEYFKAFIIEGDEEIEEFFTSLNMSPGDTNGIVPRQFQLTSDQTLIKCFNAFIRILKEEFPSTVELASKARNCYNDSYGITPSIVLKHPDRELLKWIEAEFQLFKLIENDRYQSRILSPFTSVEELVEFANTILNRRKSRAGKSLEHHLSEIFTISKVAYSSQVVTESNKRPDFLFPTTEAYHNPRFKKDKLFMLASKTTCKDRWRQILNEADRIKTKHLFTLQQGISKNQLKEMYNSHVCLVVPAEYRKSFPKEYQNKILTLTEFVSTIRTSQR